MWLLGSYEGGDVLGIAKSKKFNLEMKKLKAAIKAEYRQAFDKGIYYGTGKTLTLMCYILHNSFGFGEKRLKRIVEESMYLAECVEDDRLNLNDMEAVLQDEYNFSIEEMVE